MCSLDFEACPVWNERYRKARKQHQCAGCSGLIPAGSHYLYVSFVFEGRGGNECACSDCDTVLDAFAASHGTKPMPSDLWQTLQDCIDRRTPQHRVGPDEWAAELAGIKRRYRTSPAGRTALAAKWLRRAVSRELDLTRAHVAFAHDQRGKRP